MTHDLKMSGWPLFVPLALLPLVFMTMIRLAVPRRCAKECLENLGHVAEAHGRYMLTHGRVNHQDLNLPQSLFRCPLNGANYEMRTWEVTDRSGFEAACPNAGTHSAVAGNPNDYKKEGHVTFCDL
jgi:hypothetical protein